MCVNGTYTNIYTNIKENYQGSYGGKPNQILKQRFLKQLHDIQKLYL